MAAAAKLMAQAFTSITVKIPQAATMMGKSTAGDDGEEKDNEEEDDHAPELDDFFAQADASPELTDHPDVYVNPVVTYRIKRAKKELREARRRAELLAEGFDESEVDERMAIEGESGGTGGGRANALALLISVGARVEPPSGGQSQEHQQRLDRRRLQRNVDQFLFKNDGVEKYQTEKETAKLDRSGRRIASAAEVARETGVHRFGGDSYKRELQRVPTAKNARNIYRQWKASPAGKAFEQQLKESRKSSRASTGDSQPKGLTRQRAGGATADTAGMDQASMLAQLQAEFEGDEGEEGDFAEGEEGDFAEGEEGEWEEGEEGDEDDEVRA